MVLMGNGSPEQRHEAVTKELINGAFILMNRGQSEFEEMVQQGMHGLRAQTLSQGCGVRNITEEHGDLFALPFERTPGGEDFLGQMRRGVRQRRTVMGPQRCCGWG